jgi:hypothetical protein
MRMWLLTVGEYADEMPLGVVRANDIAEARRVAAELTIERVKNDTCDDMIYVAVTEVEDLTPDPDAPVLPIDFDEQHYAETGEEL